MSIKTKAEEILESIKEVFHETTVTKQDFPNLELAIKNLQVNGTRLPAAGPPHIDTIKLDGNQYTVVNSDHEDAPEGTVSSITSSPEGIQKLVPAPAAPMSQTAK